MPDMPVIPAIFPSILATSLSPPAPLPSSPSDPLILTFDLSLSDLLLVCFVLSLSVMAVCGVIYALFYRPQNTPDPTPVPEPDPIPAPDPLSEDLSEAFSDEERIWTTEQIAAHITRKITDCEARVTHMEQRMGNRNVAIAEQFNSLSDTLTAHVLKVARAHIDTRVEEMMQILLDAQNDSTEDVVNARLDVYLRSFDERLNRFMRQVVELLVDCAQAVLADGRISDAAVERLLTGVYTEPQTTPTPKPSPKSSPKSSGSDPFADADFGDNVEDEEAEPPRKTAEVISLRDGTDLTSEWAMELLRQRLNQEIAKEEAIEEARERAREKVRQEARAARRKAEEDERKEAEKKKTEDKDDPPEDPDDPPEDPFNPVA